jgi:hypothetical protein
VSDSQYNLYIVESAKGLSDAVRHADYSRVNYVLLLGEAERLNLPPIYGGELLVIRRKTLPYSSKKLIEFVERSQQVFVTDETFNALTSYIVKNLSNGKAVNLLSHLGARTMMNVQGLSSFLYKLRYTAFLLLSELRTLRLSVPGVYKMVLIESTVIKLDSITAGYKIPIQYTRVDYTHMSVTYKHIDWSNRVKNLLFLIPLANDLRKIKFTKNLNLNLSKILFHFPHVAKRLHVKFHPRSGTRERLLVSELLPMCAEIEASYPIELLDLSEFWVISLRTTSTSSSATAFFSMADSYGIGAEFDDAYGKIKLSDDELYGQLIPQVFSIDKADIFYALDSHN